MKPMLAAASDGTDLQYPCYASPKLDGIRALVIDGVVVSRSLKPIPNRHVQKLFGKKKHNGFDGELIVGSATAPNVFQVTTSGVMSIEGKPDVAFYIFDDVKMPNSTFEARYEYLRLRIPDQENMRRVPHSVVRDQDELMASMVQFMGQGYEGLMVRSKDGKYKFGRSTLKQGWLLKLKTFEDSEAKVIGYTQLMHNTNQAETNELGYKERSSKKDGKVGLARIGALKVKDVDTGVEFDIGTGFTQKQREELWLCRDVLKNRLVKYKYQPVGVKDKPRFPVFLGFRSEDDM